MIFEKLLQGQPEGIFGIGYNDPSTVGIICTIILLVLVVCGVRVVIAASIAGMIGLVELIGIGPALGNIGAIPYSKSVTFVLGLLPIFILIGFLAILDIKKSHTKFHHQHYFSLLDDLTLLLLELKE